MIRADRSRCCGAGMCVLIDDTVFQQDESGFVVIDDDAARAADPARLRHAVSCCPGQALSEDESGVPYDDGGAASAKSSVNRRE